MATSENADARPWLVPVLSFGAGAAVSLVVGVLLTRTAIPAMVAVDEVPLVVPTAPAEPDLFADARKVEVTDWAARSSDSVRGNVIEVEDSTDITTAAPAPIGAGMDSDAVIAAPENNYASDPNIRWFNARPARPARTIWMTVTGYSPDERSCGDSADGLTATMHSVTTNAMKLVAADPSILPYGSMISVPGYDAESIVPVLDCGGAIKGDKVDLLFPTHKEAMKWGRQRILVTVWEYADGLPAEDVRKVR